MLSFCAYAAEIAPVYTWEWTSSGLVTSANVSDWTSFNNAFGYTDGDDYATISSTYQPIKTSDFGSFTGDFTLSFDIMAGSDTNVSNWKTFASISSMGVAKAEHCLQIQMSGGYFKLFNMNSSYGHLSSSGTTLLIGTSSMTLGQMSDWVNFSIVSDITKSTLSFYIDGELAGSLDNWGPREDDSTDNFSPTGIVFGSAPDGGRDFDGEVKINNIKFYSAAVYPTPEPATASLSLLGLAALMMRRRRA